MGSAGLNKQAIAVVFARGTGDAIPMLSARLLAGKPVMNYTVQAAQNSSYVSEVWVSTEDERIANVARAAGAKVILRPESLSQHQTPLAEAVNHAADYLRESLASVGGHLLCLPADAVFCDTALIDQALETYFGGEYDQLIGLLPENKKYVIWRETQSNRLEAVIQPPHLRSSEELLFSEPGIVTIWRVGGGRVPPDNKDNQDNQRVGHILLDERQASRVDTEYDIWAAERVVDVPHVALRCDGSREMGMGHIMRLLYVARHLRQETDSEWVIRFFVGSEHLTGAQLLAEEGFDVDIVKQDDYAHWVRRLEGFKPHVIVNDLPLVPAQYLEQLQDLPAKTIALVDSVADIESGAGRLDTVISHMDEELNSPHNQFHHGLEFAPFHPSVTARLDRRSGERQRPENFKVLVSFGTGDPAGLTTSALAALAETQENWQQVAVAVREDQRDGQFQENLGRLTCPVQVIDAPSQRLGEILDQCDIALVSGGITAYEASALGVPAIVLCQNQRELARMQLFERTGSILLLGLGSEVTETQLTRALIRLSTDGALWNNMSQAGSRATDGRGVERISDIVKNLFATQVATSA